MLTMSWSGSGMQARGAANMENRTMIRVASPSLTLVRTPKAEMSAPATAEVAALRLVASANGLALGCRGSQRKAPLLVRTHLHTTGSNARQSHIDTSSRHRQRLERSLWS
mmetsp:Transcript_99291/g.318552  ORF Transcript_99291/g.318552 Transcript_99291/m.318552 type:complete len:110 (+) Transcript_99291:723-1052(+)